MWLRLSSRLLGAWNNDCIDSADWTDRRNGGRGGYRNIILGLTRQLRLLEKEDVLYLSILLGSNLNEPRGRTRPIRVEGWMDDILG